VRVTLRKRRGRVKHRRTLSRAAATSRCNARGARERNSWRIAVYGGWTPDRSRPRAGAAARDSRRTGIGTSPNCEAESR
jgi:hypothetical protein